MTNDEFVSLAVNRTRAFYERIYKPFELATDSERKRAETHLRKCFASCRSPSRLAFAFLTAVDDVETGIVRHRQRPESFRQEIVNALNSVVKPENLEEASAFIRSTLPADRNRRGR